jgi:predicted Na+-dependent transporter
MWTVLMGSFVFVGLVLAALLLGQGARRHFPRSYAAVDSILSNIELLCLVLIVLALLYSAR